MNEGGHNKPRPGKDCGDHPPITPTVNLPRSLKGEEERLYEYISRHYLASLSPDHKYVEGKLRLRCGNYYLKASSRMPRTMGWFDVMPWMN